MKVPFLDLKAYYEPLREQLDAAIADPPPESVAATELSC